MGTLPAGICVHVTPSLDVATFAPDTASYPTAAQTIPFHNASLQTPPRNADVAILRVLAPHDLPPSVDIAAVAAACWAPLAPNTIVGCWR